jgi:hypothetical protein
MSHLQVVPDSDARQTPRRVALIRPETPARVLVDQAEVVLAAPHLLLRELILAQVCVVLLSVISLFCDAPLEGIADPSNTPNPAKAPWYFLGLQELLHYFPPVVAGVLIPGLVVLAMVVIPYFRVNLADTGFLAAGRRRKLTVMTLIVVAVSALLVAFKVWAVLVPTLLVYGTLLLPVLPICPPMWRERLTRVPLSSWIMTWFVLVSAILTIIGVVFRGPEWRWVWPWQRGLHA